MKEPPPTPLQRFPEQARPQFTARTLFLVLVVIVLMILSFGLGQIVDQYYSYGFATDIAPFLGLPSFTAPSPIGTPTSGIPPTAVPLPINEDFSKEYSDLWQYFGNPLVTEKIENGQFSGVLTTGWGEVAQLWIGNTAWTNYIVSLTAGFGNGYDHHLLIGFRVADLRNMIALDCNRIRHCAWVIIQDGEREELPTRQEMYFQPLTISVEGDTFIAIGEHTYYEPKRMSFILPPKYQGKFLGGGVLLEIRSTMEVDFISIHPFP
jgi:hypothetical protein